MSSVAKEISAQTIANQIWMERQALKATSVLVEGGSDSRHLRQYLNPRTTAITVCHDRERVLLTLSILRQRSFDGVVAVIDRDFNDYIRNEDRIDDNDVILTDYNDLESTILPSCITKILNEYGSEEKIKAHSESFGDPLESLIVEASKIGAIRFINTRDKLPLRFEGMTYQFQSATSMQINLTETIHHVVTRSAPVDESRIKTEVEQALASVRPLSMLVQGHDLIRIFGRALRREFGSCAEFDKNDPLKNDLYRLLRISYEREDFLQSNIYNQMQEWERRNVPWSLLLN